MIDQATRTGFILYVVKYKECVSFYRDLLGLKVMYCAETLTCFDFGGSYLMVEVDDPRSTDPRPDQVTCLRLNVRDVKSCAQLLSSKGVEVDYQEHAWGTVAKFEDPDGNLCAFKDDAKFEAQVKDGFGSS